jgi:filamentous hemagglutinin
LKLADFVDTIVIDPQKLTSYALNPNSPRGRNKAILFEKVLGFTRENYTELLHQIRNNALYGDALFHSEDVFGKRYTVDLMIEGTAGQQAKVRTGWLVPVENDNAYLVTIYLIKR